MAAGRRCPHCRLTPSGTRLTRCASSSNRPTGRPLGMARPRRPTATSLTSATRGRTVFDRLAQQAAPERWLKPHCLEYMPLTDRLAVVRLVAELRGGFDPAADTALVVGGPDSVLKARPLG